LCSAYISAKDAESGLKSITSSIYDKTLKVTVWSETRPALTMQPDDSRQKRVSVVLLDTCISILSILMNNSDARPAEYLLRSQTLRYVQSFE